MSEKGGCMGGGSLAAEGSERGPKERTTERKRREESVSAWTQ